MIPLTDGGTETIDAGPPPPCATIPEATACTGAGSVPLCGPESNGCGGVWTLPDDLHRHGDVRRRRDAVGLRQPTCTPKTSTVACANPAGGTYCGVVSDGCGGYVTCPRVHRLRAIRAVAAGTPSVCGQPVCTPLTACPAGVNCGPWPEGCGAPMLNCGTCTSPDICGGGGVPSQCGDSPGGGGGSSCDAGLKCDLDACDGGTLATLSGQIYGPGRLEPALQRRRLRPERDRRARSRTATLRAAVARRSTRATRSRSRRPTPTETSRLTGVPVPATGNVPIVIQIGKWRRQMVWPGVVACKPNTATAAVTALAPPSRGRVTGRDPQPTVGTTLDDLPGDRRLDRRRRLDGVPLRPHRVRVERVRRGVERDERAHSHLQGTPLPTAVAENDNIRNPATMSTATPSSSASLWNSDADLNHYDIVVLSCEGEETVGSDSRRTSKTSSYARRARLRVALPLLVVQLDRSSRGRATRRRRRNTNSRPGPASRTRSTTVLDGRQPAQRRHRRDPPPTAGRP